MSGEYASYIAAAYAIAAAVLLALAFQSLRAWKKISAEAEKAGDEDA